MPEYFWLIVLIVGIIADWFLAGCFYDIACEKGFHERKYFWIPFLTGIIGYILVAALPDRKRREPEEKKPVKPLFVPQQGPSPVGKWACPDCGTVLPGDVIRCNCGYKRN